MAERSELAVGAGLVGRPADAHVGHVQMGRPTRHPFHRRERPLRGQQAERHVVVRMQSPDDDVFDPPPRATQVVADGALALEVGRHGRRGRCDGKTLGRTRQAIVDFALALSGRRL